MFAAKYQLKRVSQVATVVTETMQLHGSKSILQLFNSVSAKNN